MAARLFPVALLMFDIFSRMLIAGLAMIDIMSHARGGGGIPET